MYQDNSTPHPLAPQLAARPTPKESPASRRLLIDTVVPESASINAKAVSHIDVGRNEDLDLTQRIVFDDQDHWDASDLNLLQMAAQTVPISRFSGSLDRLVLH